ncbi:MAG: ABC transporter ATP-binding protein, partial [Candidatus Promineifilaceae bacterium]
MISFSLVSFTFPNSAAPALKNVTFRAGQGEFILVAGPSGSGKSTLLRCLNGLVPHFSGGAISGTVSVAGLNVVAAGPQALSRQVAFVFQDPERQSVLDYVEEEIAFGLENWALPRAEMRARVQQSLEILGLAELRRRPIQQLSGGERQRLALACAIAQRPAVLALDEPTSQLDPPTAEALLAAVARLNRDLGITVVIAEQRLERLAPYARRLLYLEEGQLRVDAPIQLGLARLPRGRRPALGRLAADLGWPLVPLTPLEAAPLLSNGGAGRPKEVGAEHATTWRAPAGEPLLEAHNLRFEFPGRPVLRGVSLTLRPGECTALLGPNGSGKTTLLRCLLGLLRPAAGEVRLDGRSILGADVAQVGRLIGYLPQAPDDLLFAESVEEELLFSLRNHGLSPADAPIAPAELLAELGLAELSGRHPRDLSAGQRQRAALAAILVTGPRVLLLDEPTRGLD